MTAPSSAARAQPDRCPGLLRPYRATDGALVRLRLPGGVISAPALAAVSAVSREFGAGQVQLTSRGNIQLRCITTRADGEVPDELVDRILAVGLLPSPAHELVRNISCSPFTGRVGGLADLRQLTADLDRLLCAEPELAGLPGRFLFALDDGRGDIASSDSDLGVRAVSPDRVELSVGGLRGPVIAVDAAAGALVELATRFARRRGNGPGALWHVCEMPCGGMTLLDEAGPWSSTRQAGPVSNSAPDAPTARPRYGILRQDNGGSLLSVVVPLGVLTAEQVEVLVSAAATGADELILTPWRAVVVPDFAPGVDAQQIASQFTGVGLGLDNGSGWGCVSACTGSPGCAKAAGPTRAIATRCAETSPADAVPVHVVACERRCGSPAADHVEILVRSDGLVVRRRTPAAPGSRVLESGLPDDPAPIGVAPLTGSVTAPAFAGILSSARTWR